MTVTIISLHSKTIHKLVKEQMKKDSLVYGVILEVILLKQILSRGKLGPKKWVPIELTW